MPFAGAIVNASDIPTLTPSVAGDGTNTSTFTNTSPGNQSPIVGVTFTAPPSGKVFVSINANLQLSVAGQVLAGPMVRTGSTIGSGTVFLDPSVEPVGKIGTTVLSTINGGTSQVVEGLTPAAAYNIVVACWCSSGTGTAFNRRVDVIPL